MSILLQVLACLLTGYLLGSLSPSFLAGKLRGYDVRESGSGNAGASNTVILVGSLQSSGSGSTGACSAGGIPAPRRRHRRRRRPARSGRSGC